MKRKIDTKSLIHKMGICAAAFVTFLLPVSPIRGQGVEPESTDLEYRTRGPVHEAFAQPVNFDPTPGATITQEPPAPIEEIPPDYKPEGENVVWIPGYWAWDESTSEFLWISGLWRNTPPDRNWVPGYWAATDQGYEWIEGYWQPIDVAEVDYLPTPPSTLDAGPSAPAPSEDWIWVPGCWIWATGNYAWQPGYWVEPRPEWIWIPSHYVWTPLGCVFVEGYWDYEVVERGVLFSPVHFQTSWYSRPNYYYTPSVVIDLGLFTDHLFCHRGYGHYYFGDYYASEYHHRGFFPWFEFHLGHHGYDPIFSHRRSHHRRRHHDRWERDLKADYDLRKKEKDERPAWTLAGFEGVGKEPSESRGRGRRMGHKLQELAENPSLNQGRGKLRKIEKGERDNWTAQGKRMKEFETKRLGREMAGVKDEKAPKKGPVKVRKEEIGSSPATFQKKPGKEGRQAPPKPSKGRPKVDVEQGRNIANPRVDELRKQSESDSPTKIKPSPRVERRKQQRLEQPKREQPSKGKLKQESRQVQPKQIQPKQIQPKQVQPKQIQPKQVKPKKQAPPKASPSNESSKGQEDGKGKGKGRNK